MKTLCAVGAVALWLGGAGVVHAMSIGASGGLSVLSPRGGGDTFTALGVPGTSGVFAAAFQPGLRLGSSSASGSDIFAELGLSSAMASGSNITSFQGTLNYQYRFTASGTSPFVTVGAGLMLLAGDFSSTNAVLGGGVGVRGMVADGHGAMRAELHVDYIAEDTTSFAGGVAVGIKLGFDLIL